MSNPKIYISPERRKKPHGKYWGYEVYERDYCVDLAHLVADKLIQQGFQPIIATEALTITQRPAEAEGCDFYLPLHTNASTDGSKEGTATGCEIFYKDDACKAAADIMYYYMNELYPSKRGIKPAVKPYNFYEALSMNYGCYLEVAFHDNSSDANFLISQKGAIATNIVKALCRIFGKEYITGETIDKAAYDAVVRERDEWKRSYTELEASAQAMRQRISAVIEQFDNGAN